MAKNVLRTFPSNPSQYPCSLAHRPNFKCPTWQSFCCNHRLNFKLLHSHITSEISASSRSSRDHWCPLPKSSWADFHAMKKGLPLMSPSYLLSVAIMSVITRLWTKFRHLGALASDDYNAIASLISEKYLPRKISKISWADPWTLMRIRFLHLTVHLRIDGGREWLQKAFKRYSGRFSW